MIDFIKDIFNGFKKARTSKKVLYSIFVLLYLMIIISLSVKINVEAITPGGINAHVVSEANMNIENFESSNLSVFIEKNKNPGKIYTVGVHSIKRISLFQYLISKFNSDIDYYDYNPKTDPSYGEDRLKGEKSKDASIINSLIVAYEEAKKVDESINIDYEYEGVLLTYVSKESSFDILLEDKKPRPGDIITHLNDKKPAKFSEMIKAIGNDEDFNLTYKRYDSNKNEDVITTINIRKIYVPEQERYMVGIEQIDSYNINEETANPKFQIQKKYPSIGGSGGAMQALAIYNTLLEKDITNGKIIIGTGSIAVDSYDIKTNEELFGQVGIIGGVSQKIVTAHLHNADVFFCGSENFLEAKAKADEIGAKFKVIEVKTFSDIINYLEGESYE